MQILRTQANMSFGVNFFRAVQPLGSRLVQLFETQPARRNRVCQDLTALSLDLAACLFLNDPSMLTSVCCIFQSELFYYKSLRLKVNNTIYACATESSTNQVLRVDNSNNINNMT